MSMRLNTCWTQQAPINWANGLPGKIQAPNTSRFLEPSPRVPQAHLQSTSQPPSNFPKVPLKLPCDLPIRKTHFNTSKKFSAQQRTKIMHIQY